MLLKSILALTLLFCSLSAFAKEIGRVTKLRGKVFVTNLEKNIIRGSLSQGQHINLGDVVESEQSSFVKVLMNDDTIFSIGPNSKFGFEKFAMKTKNNRDATYNLMKGKLRSIFTKKAPSRTLFIKTPLASMGVRGTEIVSDVYHVGDEVRADIALLKGKLEVHTKDGKKFDLKPSDMFEAIANSKVVAKKESPIRKKSRSVANQGFKASKKKLKKRIFKMLTKKPRKGGEIFLFDALKGERKELSKKAQFHSLTENNALRGKQPSKREKQRLSIFDENKKKEKSSRVFRRDTEREGSKIGNSEDKSVPDFDVAIEERSDIKEKPRSDFYDGSKESGRMPASASDGPAIHGSKDQMLPARKFDNAPKVEINQFSDRDARPVIGTPEVKRPMANDQMQNQIRQDIQDNIKRQIINGANTGAANRIPASNQKQINKIINQEKQKEIQKKISEEQQNAIREYLKQKNSNQGTTN